MVGGAICVCRHRSVLHRRDENGIEQCSSRILPSDICSCRGFVSMEAAPLCVCGHPWTQHRFDGSGCRHRRLCRCSAYYAIPLVPFEQLRELSRDCETVVVVVPVTNWDPRDLPIKTADLIAGDLSQTATLVLVQEGPSLYFVSKHPERDKVGAAYMTEDGLRESLLRMKRNLEEGKGHEAARGGEKSHGHTE